MENTDTEFIDIHNHKESYEKRMKTLKKDKSIIAKNRQLILSFIEDCRKGKTIKNRAKKKISPGRLLKYTSELKKLSEWFNKPFDKVTEKDVERVIENLEEDKYKIKSKKPKSYSEKTKLDFKKDLKKFFKWLFEEGEKYHTLTSWIDTHEEIREIPALSREEVEKLSDACRTRDKALIMILFDSGARIGELLNIRIGDLTRKNEGNYYMVRIKHSKTKPRTISIPMCTVILDNWLSVHPQKDDPKAQLFPIGYDALRIFLKRLGRKILKKDINPHLLRHSSATYYCHKLNQYQLCYRYGWSMASKQPARYIDREGIHEEDTAKLIKTDEISRVAGENKELREDFARLQAEHEELRKSLKNRDEWMDELVDKEVEKMLLKKIAEKNLGRILMSFKKR